MKNPRSDELLKTLKTLHPEIDFNGCIPLSTATKITPTCKEHGPFTKQVLKMMYKPFQGCPKCGASRRNNNRQVTKERFEEGVRKHWGDQFDTTNSIVTMGKQRTSVICKYHGEVSVVVSDLYRGTRGCPECGKESSIKSRLMDEVEFISRAKEILGDNYDFSKVDYINSQTKVRLICKDHGEFSITPNSILSQHQGCKKCGYIRAGVNQKLSKAEEYKRLLEEKYGEIYDLSLTEYVDRKTPLVVICKKHGPFTVDSWAFLNGRVGCTYCSGKYLCNDDYRQRLEQIHGKGRYTYDLIETTKKKFGITCNICGNKWYTLVMHLLRGSGCPNCAKSGFNPDKPATLYCIEFILPNNTRIYKVGITNNSVLSRIVGMKVSSRILYKVIYEEQFEVGRSAFDKEQSIHSEFKDYEYKGKPFLKNGFTELFTVNPFTYKRTQ